MIHFIVGLLNANQATLISASTLAGFGRSRFPCNFRTQLYVPNWKQAHLTWAPEPVRDWPGNVSRIAVYSPLLLDRPAGRIFFVGEDGKVYNYYWDEDHDWRIQALNWGQWQRIDPVGGLAMDSTGKLFGIGTDRRAYNFYYAGGSWHFAALVPSQFAPIEPHGGLAIDSSGKIFAIGVDGKVYNFYWQNGAWVFVVLNPNQYRKIDARGGLTVDESGKIFAVGTDGKVYNFYWEGGAWVFVALNPNQYHAIDARGGLALDASGKVFAVGTDGKVYNFYWNGNNWEFQWLNPNQYTRIDAAGKLLVYEGKVYAIGTDGKVYNFFWNGNNWEFQWLVPNPSMAASTDGGLQVDSTGKLFVIGGDGRVYNYYWDGATWVFAVLTPLQYDMARSSNRLAVGDSVYFSSLPGYLEAIFYGNGHLDHSQWDPVVVWNFTTNSLTLASLLNDWIMEYPWGHTQSSSILAGYEWEYNWNNAFSMGAGRLRIMAMNQPHWAKLVEGMDLNAVMSDGNPNFRKFDFTSGAMTTKAAYTFGLFEIHCQVPAGRGFWPAFWLTGADSWPPEIDVFEFDGTHPSACSNNLHWQIAGGETDHCGMEYHVPEDLTEAYHTFAMAWLPEKIVMYLDGQELRTIDHHVPQTPMRVIVNLAVGLHYPDPATPFPSSLDIAWIRIHQHN